MQDTSPSSSVLRDIIKHVLLNIIILSSIVLTICLASLPIHPLRFALDGRWIVPSTTMKYVHASLRWSTAQLIKSISSPTFADGSLWEVADSWEAKSWNEWEGMMIKHHEEEQGKTAPSSTTTVMEVPVLDLRECLSSIGSSSEGITTCRPSISDAEKLLGNDFLSRPLLLRGLWTNEQLQDPNRRLSLRGMTEHANLANLSVPFYADATKTGYSALKPSGVAPLGEIVRNITDCGKQKIGSQVLVETYPDLIEEVAPIELITELFGNHFDSDRIKGSGPFGMFPAWTTVPVFLAGSTAVADVVRADEKDTQQVNKHPRTDLHCEPIGNVAVQLHGSKLWALVAPEQSVLLKPSVSRHGRAFYYSNLDPFDPTALDSIPHYKLVTNAGDALWVPPWTWHRVDYLNNENKASKDKTSLAASLFHFRPLQFATNNALFALLMIPNLVKELLGRNTE